jgi:hypothetical protein
LGAYDSTKALVIDPVLTYSTYLGGNSHDEANGITIDSQGNAYVVGTTSSTNFPVTPGAYQTQLGGTVTATYDAFVTKLNPQGNALIYSTFIGGRQGGEYGLSIAINPAGEAHIAGETWSQDFPMPPGAYQSTLRGSQDAYVAKLNANGSSLLYATFLGGSGAEYNPSLAINNFGEVYVAGRTTSQNFPMVGAGFQGFAGGGNCPTGACSDGFLLQLPLTPNGRPVFSTYLGGSGDDYIDGVTFLRNDDEAIYVTGSTNSANFPVTFRAFQRDKAGEPQTYDTFITRFDKSGTRLLYSTYFGGAGDDYAYDIAIDDAGDAYITGMTGSPDLPMTPDAFQPMLQGFGSARYDAFLAKLHRGGHDLLYSTFIGGASDDAGIALALLPSTPEVYIVGHTTSPDLPTAPHALQATLGGSYDAFLIRITPGQQYLNYLTYIGGSEYEQGKDIAVGYVNFMPNVYIAGSTWSEDFYATTNAFQRFKGGQYNSDGFVTRIDMGQEGLVVTGRVTNEFGNGLADVEVTFSGSINRSVRTNNEGIYRMGGIPQGSTVTLNAHRDGYLFEPRNVPLNNLVQHATVDFSGAAPLVIKGRITNPMGTGVGGAFIMLNGTVSNSTQSDMNGYYRFAGLPAGGSYTVTPGQTPIIAYTPESQSVSNITGDSVLDFMQLPPPKIWGRITDINSGFPRSYFAVRLSNEQGSVIEETYTDNDGNYQFYNLLRGATYTVTPREPMPNWTFTPPTHTAANIQGEQRLDFTSVPPIDAVGQVKDEYGNPLSGVTVTLSGVMDATTQTDYSGWYRFHHLPRNCSFTVAASMPGMFWTFTPASVTVPDAYTTWTTHFTALPPLRIYGQVLNDYGSPMGGVTIALSGSANVTTQTDSSGWYFFNELQRGGNYTATPILPDTFWTFAPATQSVTNAQEFQNWNFNGLPPLRIRGQITDENGNAVAGANVALTGAVNASTQTDDSGWYFFNELRRGGTYTVAVSHELYNFNPPTQTVTDINEIQLLSFSAVFKRYQISGRIVDGGGAGLARVTLQLEGGGYGTTQTDADGNYSFNNLIVARRYDVTPTRAGWSFAPQTYTNTDLRGNQTANFNATRLTYTLSGRTIDANGAPLSGVTLNLGGTQTATTQTDAQGNYAFTGLASEGNYTVNAAHANYTFTPTEQTFNNLLSNLPLSDFTGTRIRYAVNGRITDGAGAALSGVTVTLGGAQSATTFTDANGNYIFPDLLSGNAYTVTPSAAHYVFNPSNKTIDNLGANTTADFNATLLRHYITGRIADANGNAVVGATVNLNGAQTATVQTDANGKYAFPNLPAGGNYTVSPFHSWYGFSPTALSFNDLGADQQAADFAGTLHTFQLGGHIREGGVALAGVTVNLGGTRTATAQTDATGWYAFSVPAGGNYTVAASHPYFVFAPSGATFNNLPGHQTADFAATRLAYQVSGYARDACGRAISAVTMSLARTGGATLTAQTDANGFYAFPGQPAGYSYTLTTTKTSYTFNPPSVSYANLNTNQLSNFTGTPDAATTQLAPTADAYVRAGGSAATNFGTATQLISRLGSSAGNTYETYLTFDVGQLCTVSSVKLRLYGKLSAGSNLSVSAYGVANTAWTETGINWNNKPAAGSLLATKVIANTTSAFYEWDVTAYVRSEINAGRTRISLVLKNPSVSSNEATFNSRQATTNQPRLVLTTP